MFCSLIDLPRPGQHPFFPFHFPSGGGTSVGKEKPYVFDRVFDAGATQQEVYEKTAAPILRDVLKGYNGAILAYGQTGSGKTHSMLSLASTPGAPEAGLVARIADELFTRVDSDPAREYTVLASVVQIYNEQLDDMLRPPPAAGAPPGAAAAGTNLTIRKDGGQDWVIDGLTWQTCLSAGESVRLLAGRLRGRGARLHA